ncbi:DEAD/DEAH box helicase [Myxococcota bacterium]|nr:DEAD/DEAH box helicase [Myxococcota bacterium]
MTPDGSFAVGSLVRARGREWVVLPESQGELLILRPLGGTDDEVAGVYTPLEAVESATFDLPDPARVGDHRACRLLRDAARIVTRAGAGPFRSLARIAVEPRPYQLVPLLMALKLDPVRLLIADDVGIGKTVEAALIARELLDRGEVQRLAVLCPPHLSEQWQTELREKFHIDAELVLARTASRLERGLHVGESLFDVHPHVIVSMDFIKSEQRRDEFVRACPELVIVDEAHTCAFGDETRGGRHQRHQLVTRLAADPARHLILVTATPHSGKEDAFRSLLALLDPGFAQLPDDLGGKANEAERRRLARHFVQRRRADIEAFLDTETPFPTRLEREETYQLSKPYRALFEKVIAYARETAQDASGGEHRQRVRWWSALALLRALASSPMAAAATLRNRAAMADTETVSEADALGRRTVLDDSAQDADGELDAAPGADARPSDDDDASDGRASGGDPRLLRLAREAEALAGADDAKLAKATALLKELLADGQHPIVFCRFIPTAEYLGAALRKALPRNTEVAVVTGLLPPDEREARIAELGEQRAQGKAIALVCTDCLSEGMNLQEHFDAVVHYDLAWSPTRHEQREGRVDRYGQPRPEVRVLTYYGTDNAIDGIVLDVLLRKHKTIRSSLGISVPVPMDTNAVVEAIFEGLLLREKGGGSQLLLPGLDAMLARESRQLHGAWEAAAAREKRSRTVFAQETIRPEEIRPELDAARAALGSPDTVRTFVEDALRAHGAVLEKRGNGLDIDLARTPRALRDLCPELPDRFRARFELPVGDGVLHLSRTHPLVEGLAAHVLDTALDSAPERAASAVAQRAGAIRTAAVATRTTLLLCRFRFDLTTSRAGAEQTQLAEEMALLAFEGAPHADAAWLPPERAEALLAAGPAGNISDEQKRRFVAAVVDGAGALVPAIEAEAARRAEALLAAHRRVRSAARERRLSYRVEPQLPADVLGIFVLLPAEP